jgi:nucleoside-diphosphate-sugar epimerase
MNILVTGGAGYVGTTLVPVLLQAGHKVRVYDSLMFGGKGLLPCFRNRDFELVVGDTRNEPDLAKALEGIDIVIHLAAIVGYPACKKHERLANEVNYEATVLLEKTRGKDVPVIFASTGSNYGALIGDLCTEETPLNPLTVYGQTKTAAEEHLMKMGNVVCYRFATAFGVSGRMRLDLLINDFVYQAVKNRNLIIYEKSFKRTFIHVADMAAAFLFAVDNMDRMRDNVFNVGSEDMNWSKEEVARKIRDKVEFYLHFAEVGTDEDKRNYEVSYEKISSFGYRTAIAIDDGIDELIRAVKVLEIKNEFSNV